jgi:hypothetical protein
MGSVPQLPQKKAFYTAKSMKLPLASRARRSSIHFTGGAILQQEESKRGDIHEDSEEESEDPQGKFEETDEGIEIRRTGNRAQGDRTNRAFAATVITVGSGKAGPHGFASTGQD